MMAQAQLKLAPTEFTQAVPQFQNKVLDVKGLTKSYKAGRRVLNDISFDLHAGEFVAVIGRSGAGKSTLLHVLNGTLPLSEGSVICQYEDLLYLGIPNFLNIDHREGFLFSSSTLAMGVLVLEILLALTVIMWGYGSQLF